MRVIVVERPGLLSTIQDLGRPGYGPLGVSACGAADPTALRVGNRLVGNPDGAPAIELTMAGGSFVFPEGGQIALTGSEFECSHEFWRTQRLAPGERLRIGRSLSDARCYLCVRGGIAVPRTLGSASTHLVSRLGGLNGGPLQAGDRLPIGPEPGGLARTRVRRAALDTLRPRKTFGVTPGPQHGWFSTDVAAHEYKVIAQSNRTGIRLSGEPLLVQQDAMITEGMSLGAIQAPPDGQPIILFVDAQTTGGYAVAANVIAAHLPSLGQLRPGDQVRFKWVAIEEAQALYLERERLLQSDELLW